MRPTILIKYENLTLRRPEGPSRRAGFPVHKPGRRFSHNLGRPRSGERAPPGHREKRSDEATRSGRLIRSEESRVGKECVEPGRYRCAPSNKKKKRPTKKKCKTHGNEEYKKKPKKH